MCVKLFGTESFDDSYVPTMSLLNTIKVPKNLLYLTDRLPKPSYELVEKSQKQKPKHSSRHRKETLENSNDELPPLSSKRTNNSPDKHDDSVGTAQSKK